MFEEFLRGVEGGVGGRHATVRGSLQKNFLNFVARHAERERGFEVHAEFRLAVLSDEHREGKQAAGLTRQAGATPDFSPGEAGDQILNRSIEIPAIFQLASHMPAPESTTPRF